MIRDQSVVLCRSKTYLIFTCYCNIYLSLLHLNGTWTHFIVDFFLLCRWSGLSLPAFLQLSWFIEAHGIPRCALKDRGLSNKPIQYILHMRNGRYFLSVGIVVFLFFRSYVDRIKKNKFLKNRICNVMPWRWQVCLASRYGNFCTSDPYAAFYQSVHLYFLCAVSTV